MRNIDWISYIKIMLGLLGPTMLAWIYFHLDFSVIDATLITLVMYVVLVGLGFIMFNYLETGHGLMMAKKFKSKYDDRYFKRY